MPAREPSVGLGRKLPFLPLTWHLPRGIFKRTLCYFRHPSTGATSTVTVAAWNVPSNPQTHRSFSLEERPSPNQKGISVVIQVGSPYVCKGTIDHWCFAAFERHGSRCWTPVSLALCVLKNEVTEGSKRGIFILSPKEQQVAAHGCPGIRTEPKGET